MHEYLGTYARVFMYTCVWAMTSLVIHLVQVSVRGEGLGTSIHRLEGTL